MKKFKNSLLAILLAASIVACGNAETNNAEDIEKEDSSKQIDQTIEVEKSEPVAKEENQTEVEDDVKDQETQVVKETSEVEKEVASEDENLITEDGQYYTAYNPQSDGGINEYNLPETNSWKLEEYLLTVSGTLQNPYPDGEYTENKIHTFKLTDATTFTGVGADGEFETPKENHIDQGAPSNIITVENGVVTNIRFGS